MPLFETITDLVAGADRIRQRRYGVVEMRAGRFVALRLRPFPKIATWADAHVFGRRFHIRAPGDCCRLYYNQPRGFEQFLALVFVVSSRGGSLASFHGALNVLDEIARLKRSDAILCDACNVRISDRLLRRWGWEPHKPSRWHRHYIKRFYGVYPGRSQVEERCLAASA